MLKPVYISGFITGRRRKVDHQNWSNPRCSGTITPGHQGGPSRRDDKTQICCHCERDEVELDRLAAEMIIKRHIGRPQRLIPDHLIVRGRPKRTKNDRPRPFGSQSNEESVIGAKRYSHLIVLDAGELGI